MSTSVIKSLPFAVLLAAGAVGAMAQGTTTTPSKTPTGVGVSPQTAAEANQKAIPRSDTGTVVQTGPTAADRARGAASSASAAIGNAGSAIGNAGTSMSNTVRGNRTNDTTGTTGMSGTSGTSGTGMNGTSGMSGTGTSSDTMSTGGNGRRARADRN